MKKGALLLLILVYGARDTRLERTVAIKTGPYSS